MSVPVLNIALPRPITGIHQIELSSVCNLRCQYCPSPHLGRPKLHMEEAVFARALEWVAYFCQKGTQGELNLAGIGESTMHPQFADFISRARKVVGPDGKMLIATNGVSFTEDIARAAAEVNLRVFVSLHRPEVAGPAIKRAERFGIFEGVSADPSINANDWAGQVKLKFTPTPQRIGCPWMRGGWAFVLADGRMSRCCLDATGEGTFAHVNDTGLWEGPTFIETSPWKLCKTCYQDINIACYDQAKGEYR